MDEFRNIKMVRIIRTVFRLMAAAFAVASCAARPFSLENAPLELEFVCDFADWTPEDVAVEGSTQGLAIHGKYAFVMHHGGMCCVFDMKKKALVSAFMMDGNTGHCNNAAFGIEKATPSSQFPLLYVSECGGEKSYCFVSDVTTEGSRLVQKILFKGSGFPAAIDWGLDKQNGFLYAYGGLNGDFKILKKFRLPKLSDSDENGEVVLTDADVLDEVRIDEGINIWQGNCEMGRYAFLPDGYDPYDLLLHVVDLEEKKIALTKDLKELVDEPEGVDYQGKWLYVLFNTTSQPRHSKLWRFSLR